MNEEENRKSTEKANRDLFNLIVILVLTIFASEFIKGFTHPDSIEDYSEPAEKQSMELRLSRKKLDNIDRSLSGLAYTCPKRRKKLLEAVQLALEQRRSHERSSAATGVISKY